MTLMKTACQLFLLFFIVHVPGWAADSSSTWYTKGTNNTITINVELFLSSTCPHCHKANEFFRTIEARSPDLHIQRYFINQDKNALIRFNQLLNAQQMDDFAVPSIYFCNSRWVGFASDDTTGKDLVHAINYCRQQIEKKGELSEATVNTLRHWANANRFDSGMVEKPSRFRYTVTIGLMDAFSPCALFCFAGFCAVLVLGEQRKKQIIASLLFISSVVIIHYFQQVYTNIFFELLPWLRIPAALLGLSTVYFVIQHYSKKCSAILYFILAFLLGLVVTVYQQTCVMNWSTIFQQWLNNQQIPNWQAYLYQLLYQSIYILPLLLILIVALILLHLERFATLKRKLMRIGLLFFMALALCLIFYPFMLSYFTTSILVLLFLIVCGYFLNLT